MIKKIVLTGAQGRLGSYLREPLSKMTESLISTDITNAPKELNQNEEYIQADLADMNAIKDIVAGADMVVHFGAVADEASFETLLGPNFIGAYNIWESARQHKVKRVVYASSIHAVGMYPKNEFIGVDVPHRPDTFYGLAKCFSEDLARMYFEKAQIEAVCLRIVSCAQVTSSRALGTYLSYDDLVQLVTRSIDTPVTGFTVVYGVSNNDRSGLDNSKASFLGYRPKDNAEIHAEAILRDAPSADHTDLAQYCHGGPFATTPLGESGTASMNIVDDRKTE